MRAYYNEFDPYCVEVLKRLIAAGEIAPGDVDNRSIEDVTPSDIENYSQCHFFAGIGLWSYALRLAGVEDDDRVWTGSCPCQPFSAAGKGAGFTDERHLWPSWFWLIKQRQPVKIFGEQVAQGIAFEWLDVVASDMERENYAFAAASMPAASIGAKHKRQRLSWFAHAPDAERDKQPREKSRSRQVRRMGRVIKPLPQNADWQNTLTLFRGVDDGYPRRLGATDAIRNAIVPQQQAVFIREAFDLI